MNRSGGRWIQAIPESALAQPGPRETSDPAAHGAHCFRVQRFQRGRVALYCDVLDLHQTGGLERP